MTIPPQYRRQSESRPDQEFMGIFVFGFFILIAILATQKTIASKIAATGIIQCQWLISIPIHSTSLFDFVSILSGKYVVFMWVQKKAPGCLGIPEANIKIYYMP